MPTFAAPDDAPRRPDAGDAALRVRGLRHRLGRRVVLDGLDLEVARGERFALLGPNGSGKTTLFRLVSTLLPPDEGVIEVFGVDVARRPDAARRHLGVVFQHAALDGQLTVRENLRHAGRLFGLDRRTIAARSDSLLDRFGVRERGNDRVATLSGGLMRRVELAKALLHGPDLLLLDEPSTGLDPGARRELLGVLRDEQARTGATVVLTTHLLDEADHADRVAVLDRGRIVAEGAPDALKSAVGGDVLTVTAADPDAAARTLRERFGRDVRIVDGVVRMEAEDAATLVPHLAAALGPDLVAIALARPSLEDVFTHHTGRRFDSAADGATSGSGHA